MNIVIHPNDPSTSFLSDLYYNRDFIKKDILLGDSETVMMLGHGTEYGLLNEDLSKFIVDQSDVQYLRYKVCIGIWCNANMFAESYSLHGLFSGMIISEPREAYDLGINVYEGEIEKENKRLGSLLRYCLDRYRLEDIPKALIKLSDPSTELTKFNYNNFFYY